MDVSEDELQGLYTWVDEIPLSRPKRSIARDFSDGVLVAEIIAHYFPKYVELHNYSSASSVTQKLYNWNTLNQKVFRKLHFSANKVDVEAICNCVPGAIERFLKLLQVKIANHRSKSSRSLCAPHSKIEYQRSQQDLSAPTSAVPNPHPDGRPQEYMQQPPQYAVQRPTSAAIPSETQAYPHPPAESFPASRPNEDGRIGVAAQVQQNYQQQQQQQQYNLAHPSYQHSLEMQIPCPTIAYPNQGSDASVLADRDATIAELRETNEILELKVRKLEQLVRLKDAKIQTLLAKLHTNDNAP